ncbi:hypothetical protein ACWHY4_23185, partial [Pseudomonas sp. E2-15]
INVCWADVIAGKSNRRTAAPTFNLRCFGHCVRLTERHQGKPARHKSSLALAMGSSWALGGREILTQS